ncbi:MAG: phosphodiester glycosidase family protein [Verrucomicrobiota bacterium]
MKYILILLVLLNSFAHAERSYVIERGSIRIHVIEFSEFENSGFGFIDGKKKKSFVTDLYSEEDHSFIVNGGYFDGNLNPVGLFRINGVDISNTKDPRLSGFVTITEEGELELHWKRIPEIEYDDIVQSGPFVIDPGGKIGIRSRSGKEAKRTIIGRTKNNRTLVITTNEVYLYDLAIILNSEIPDLDRALNLDGGPSVGLIYGDIRIQNSNPVRNFLTKIRVNQMGDDNSE